MLRFAAVTLCTLGIVATSVAASSSKAAPAFRVTMYGDSAADVLEYVPEARQYLTQGLDLDLELKVCRRLVQLSCPYQGVRPPTVLDLVQAAGKGALGSVVVIDVGYNDYVASYRDDMEQVVHALMDKGVQHIVWTTLHESRDDYRVINQMIRAEAAKWPQVVIADWNQASQGQDWFSSDGVHMNAGGALGLAVLLRRAILAFCDDPCPAQSPPPKPSFVVRASKRSIDVGNFRVWKPPLRGTYGTATAAFGPASSCRALPNDKSRASWSELGIAAQFVAAAGFTCSAPSRLYLQTLTATGTSWRTTKGLAVGDPVPKLVRLYPDAVRHPGTFWIVKADRGKNHALFFATTRGGRVTAFSVAVRVGP
jgi:hypothetical protein